MRGIIFLIVLGISIYVMVTEKKKVPQETISSDSLSKKQKILIWVLCIFDPLIAGAILYYGWKKRLPTKAKEANSISWKAALIVAGITIIVLVLVSYAKGSA